MSADELAELRKRVDVFAGILAAAYRAEGLPVPPELGVTRPGDWGPQRRPRHLSLVPQAAPDLEPGRWQGRRCPAGYG